MRYTRVCFLLNKKKIKLKWPITKKDGSKHDIGKFIKNPTDVIFSAITPCGKN